jgi:nucleoside-diphosphate-sugar epimerase
LKNYRVLLVGGAGTLGSDILASNLPNFTFFVVDDFKESTLTEIEVAKYCDYKNTNAADYAEMRDVFLKFKPNVVIYLATTVSDDQNRALESNVLGLKNVIAESTTNNFPHVIYIQSFLTRETNQPITEKTPKVAHDSYSTWKLAGEILLSSYQGKKTTIILSSVISPLISIGAIPAFVKKILANDPITITETSRDYLDPQSFIDALEIVMIEELNMSEIVIGSGIGITTEEILSQVSLVLGLDSDKFKFAVTDPKPSDPKRVTLDSSLFQELTNWKPGLDLDRQINRIIDNLKLKKEFSVRLHH